VIVNLLVVHEDDRFHLTLGLRHGGNGKDTAQNEEYHEHDAVTRIAHTSDYPDDLQVSSVGMGVSEVIHLARDREFPAGERSILESGSCVHVARTVLSPSWNVEG
jgi:hypothetical protein